MWKREPVSGCIRVEGADISFEQLEVAGPIFVPRGPLRRQVAALAQRPHRLWVNEVHDAVDRAATCGARELRRLKFPPKRHRYP